MSKNSLTPDQARIAAAFGMSPLEFGTKTAQLSATAKSAWGLSENQQAVCRATGMSEHAFATAAGIKTRSPGLLRAHKEIDRAQDTLYDDDSGHEVDPPDRQLLDLAMTELKAWKPDDDDTYNSLLKGALYVVTLLDRVAPPFAKNKDID